MLKNARRKRLVSSVLSIAAVLSLLLFGGVASAGERGQGKKPLKRDVLAVSNNWDGTVDLVNPHNFRRLERINVAPDYNERFAEILLAPDRLALFLAIRNQIGEGNDQLADDAFTSPNGRFIYVSRPSLADVVAINMRTERIKWRVADGGLPLGPHGHLRERAARAGVRLDREQGARDQHQAGRDRRLLPVRRLAAREQLLRQRQANLPREHRHGLHADATSPELDTSKGDR